MTNAETNDKAATIAEQSAHSAPAQGSSRQKKRAPKAKKSAKAAAPKKAAKGPQQVRKTASEARTNKKVEVIAMMKRAKGATLAEIMEATDWQRHTVRGFVSILCSKGVEKIESAKNAAGERTYKIAK